MTTVENPISETASDTGDTPTNVENPISEIALPQCSYQCRESDIGDSAPSQQCLFEIALSHPLIHGSDNFCGGLGRLRRPLILFAGLLLYLGGFMGFIICAFLLRIRDDRKN